MLNKMQIIGRLGDDPEVRSTQNGTSVANFNVATNEKWRDKDGEMQEKVEWHRIVVWGKLADICGEHLSKGRQVYVEGKLQTRKWQDRDGNDRYTTEIVAREVKFLGGKSDGQSEKKTEKQDESWDKEEYQQPPMQGDPVPF